MGRGDVYGAGVIRAPASHRVRGRGVGGGRRRVGGGGAVVRVRGKSRRRTGGGSAGGTRSIDSLVRSPVHASRRMGAASVGFVVAAAPAGTERHPVLGEDPDAHVFRGHPVASAVASIVSVPSTSSRLFPTISLR